MRCLFFDNLANSDDVELSEEESVPDVNSFPQAEESSVSCNSDGDVHSDVYMDPHEVAEACQEWDPTQNFPLSDPSLLRCITIGLLLSRLARLLKRTQGAQIDSVQSREVSAIDVFISHNWDTARWIKAIAIAMHFNFVFATRVTILVMAFISALFVADRLPAPAGQVGMIVVERCPWCVLLVWPLFWVLLLCRYDLYSVLCFKESGPTVFFDKACIEQDDVGRRDMGICAIPAIVARSKVFLVVLTPLLFTRVWTMLEISVFVVASRYKTECLSIQAAPLRKLEFVGSLWIWIACWVTMTSSFIGVGAGWVAIHSLCYG